MGTGTTLTVAVHQPGYHRHLYYFAKMLAAASEPGISRPDGLDAALGLTDKGYRLSETQAQAILDLRLHRLTGLEQEKLLKEKDPVPSVEDFKEGLTAVIAAKVPEPQFEGQTKSKLNNREVQSIVETVVGEGLRTWFEESPAAAKSLYGKVIDALRAREAAR